MAINPKFKVGDRIKLRNSDVEIHWILAAEIEYFEEGNAYLRATEVSNDNWLNDMYRESIRALNTEWELDYEYAAKQKFDKELEELLK